MSRLFFSSALFLSAFLLFMIQPVVAKSFLPHYGGTPSVWTVCVLFFQLLLLISYGYVWLLSQIRGVITWRVVHICICLASLASFPMLIHASAFSSIPEFNILFSLLTQIGIPLFVIGTSAPLLQYAYSQTKNAQYATDPYFLYAASNIGSLFILISYPWMIERFIDLNHQLNLWKSLYWLYLVLVIIIFSVFRYQPNHFISKQTVALPLKPQLKWLIWAFIPCSLMMGVTFYITTDVASVPLFWVLPLALYLLTFIITFSRRPLIKQSWVKRNLRLFIVFPWLAFILGPSHIPAWQLVLSHLASFFVLALWFHALLAQDRPPTSGLTTFYFLMALGGVLAGLFNGLIAPALFNTALEYPLIMLMMLLFIPILGPYQQKEWKLVALVILLLGCSYFMPHDIWVRRYHVVEIIALAVAMTSLQRPFMVFLSILGIFLMVFMPWFKSSESLTKQRNFYGIKEVISYSGAHALISQNTIHGFQLRTIDQPNLQGTQAYYGAVYPVIRYLQTQAPQLKAMVLGLGTGIMACQFRSQDEVVMVEVDQQVIDIAKNTDLFTYLHDCPTKLHLIRQDGRMAASQAADRSFDVLVMDAFNSDAIPMHLITEEAFQIYQQKLKANGILLINISNRHLNILPVLNSVARKFELIILHKTLKMDQKLGQFASEWVVLTQNESLAGQLMSHEQWQFVADAKKIAWTDNYSNILSVLKW